MPMTCYLKRDLFCQMYQTIPLTLVNMGGKSHACQIQLGSFSHFMGPITKILRSYFDVKNIEGKHGCTKIMLLQITSQSIF